MKTMYRVTQILTMLILFMSSMSLLASDKEARIESYSRESGVFRTHLNALGPAPVNLQSAGMFTILAGAGVTSTGFTIINGDLGTSPIATYTGFPPGVVNGTIHAGDAIPAQDKLDLTTALHDA